jgi:hypothetical protein
MSDKYIVTLHTADGNHTIQEVTDEDPEPFRDLVEKASTPGYAIEYSQVSNNSITVEKQSK